MTFKRNALQECGTLNRVFAAFFINECEFKNNIQFYDSRPQMPSISSLNHDGVYIVEDHLPYGTKHFFHGKVVIDNFNLNELESSHLEDFFDQSMKDKLSDVSKYFAQAVNTFQYCDFVFSGLPDVTPFIYDCIKDEETNFRSRFILSHDTMFNRYHATWEFYALLMERFRAVEPHTVYGIAFKSVDKMTDEEREKYNKQPERNYNE